MMYKKEQRWEIIAISEYYSIPLRLTSARRDIIDEKEMEYIIEWWMAKKEQE